MRDNFPYTKSQNCFSFEKVSRLWFEIVQDSETFLVEMKQRIPGGVMYYHEIYLAIEFVENFFDFDGSIMTHVTFLTSVGCYQETCPF